MTVNSGLWRRRRKPAATSSTRQSACTLKAHSMPLLCSIKLFLLPSATLWSGVPTCATNRNAATRFSLRRIHPWFSLHTPAGLSDENLQRTWNAKLPAMQGPYNQQQHMDGTWLQAQDSSQSQWRRWAGLLPPADHSHSEGPGSHPCSNYLVQHPQYGTQAPVRDSSGCFSPQQQRSELLLDAHDPDH